MGCPLERGTLYVLHSGHSASVVIDSYVDPDVRMRYKNKNLILPMCAKEGDHFPGSPEFCTLSVFQQRVKELTPVNWSAECAGS